MRKQTLNIPLKLMKRYRKDKQMWELFIFAVCIKCLSGSSGIHADVMAVRKMMRCSHNKAIRMIERAKMCKDLFTYNNKTNSLVARSFTRGKLEKNIVVSRHAEYTAYSAYCYKLRYDANKGISHFAVSQFLRDRLLLCSIYAKQRKNDFLTVANISSRIDRSKALSAKRLSRIAGVHHTTVTRHLRKLEAAGQITVKRHDFIKVADFYSDEVLTDDSRLLERKPFLRQGYWVVKDANEYKATASNDDVFTNVIFNHAKRHRRNYSGSELAIAHYDN